MGAGEGGVVGRRCSEVGGEGAGGHGGDGRVGGGVIVGVEQVARARNVEAIPLRPPTLSLTV